LIDENLKYFNDPVTTELSPMVLSKDPSYKNLSWHVRPMTSRDLWRWRLWISATPSDEEPGNSWGRIRCYLWAWSRAC